MPNTPRTAKQPADRLAKESQNADQASTGDFKGTPIRVLPFLDWDRHAIAHLNVLNFDAWAQCAVHPEDVKKFLAVKATMRETLNFITEISEHAGADLGELRASLLS